MKFLACVSLGLLIASFLVSCAGTASQDGPGGIQAPPGTGVDSVYETQDRAIRQLIY